MSALIIAEKPSVARDIAKVLGARSKGDGYLSGNGYTVTWALGHLVALAEPHEIDAAWKAWRRELLPMLPPRWPLKVLSKTRSQFAVIRRLLKDETLERVICATDAGREGELIFRYIYEKAGCTKPVERLWISSLTPQAIRAGFDRLRTGAAYDALAQAAKGRSRADWLVGMNLSRAYSLLHDAHFSVGRVQTPTLAMVVERTHAINEFVPEDYLEVTATFAVEDGEYVGVYIDKDKKSRLPADGALAGEIAARARTGRATVAHIKKETRRRTPLLLYDLTELQRHANRLFGFSAKRTLEIAQRLYEKHKLISYPRTDSRFLTEDVAATLEPIVAVIRGPYEEKLAPGTGTRPLGRRFVNDARVNDHHAIIPTTVHGGGLVPGSDDAKIYDLVCRRLLSAWQPDHIACVTTVLTEIAAADAAAVDRYRASGTLVEQEGWKVLDPPLPFKKKAPGERHDAQQFPPSLKQGDSPEVTGADILKKRTKPPKPFTEATLLTAMETAGKTLEDKALVDAMRENGLGTPATRAAIIETLLSREYIVRQGKSLFATDKGAELVRVVHDHVKSPAMTGRWEHRLREIERGRDDLKSFMADIERFIKEVVAAVNEAPARRSGRPAARRSERPAGEATVNGPAIATASGGALPPTDVRTDDGLEPASPLREPVASRPGESLRSLLGRTFGFDAFRPHQETVCRAVRDGHNVLLVMPTGAGKSLCYQLPGIARGGTTLVISPLIALMEDQSVQLRQRGFRAERIHSGMTREASREVCRRYLTGALDYLFIAPERLRVTGFPEMLAKRPPVLVAVDEAHCISHWGHDFRPDYRMLQERLALLRSAPVIAMTATATPIVQDDIVRQLGMPEARRFIHGFRRTNIAVEIAELPPGARSAEALRILRDPARRPAIVYAPTRKKAEALASDLGGSMSAAAYHAGMNPALREQVQADFLADRVTVIVATIAFGMGIDKPDVRTVIHAALPGSIESYYQEIGRAGRDGHPSRAILMYSFADLRTHQFFLERDYPEPRELERVYRLLTPERQPQQQLARILGIEEDQLGNMLEKLWIHGGAEVGFDETVRRGANLWKPPYMAQRRHKEQQLELMAAFAGAMECRMLRLVRHFGDQEDHGGPCGCCDICRPKESLSRRTRSASDEEARHMTLLLKELAQASDQAKGKLYRDAFEGRITRREYETLVEALFRAGLIGIDQDRFTKEGRTIEFQRLSLTPEGYRTLREGKLRDAVDLTETRSRSKKTRRSRTSARKGETAPKKRSPSGARAPTPAPDPDLVSALKAWRLELARKRNIPAFRILTDRVLFGIAAERPKDEDALLAISGVGETILKRYGKRILKICAR